MTIGCNQFKAHRVIFAMTHGRWPVDQIDHINGIKSDNRPCNLREATNADNQHNQGIYRTNNSGVKGVCWEKHTQKWQATICVNGKNKNLGRFHNIEDARMAYVRAAETYHGAFAQRIASP